MSDNSFKFCPKCGKQNVEYLKNKKWFCRDCGFDLYNNVAGAVGVVISDAQNNVLFEIRAKDPRKGFLALPGGFIDQNETAEAAVARECLEETGMKVESVSYLCSFPNDYEYKDIAYKTCDLFFTANVPDSEGSVEELIKELHGQQSEVTGFLACRVDSREDVERLPLAFPSARKALSEWIEKRNRN